MLVCYRMACVWFCNNRSCNKPGALSVLDPVCVSWLFLTFTNTGVVGLSSCRILGGVRRYLTVVLMCIFLMTDDVGHALIGLFATCKSLARWLFKSYAFYKKSCLTLFPYCSVKRVFLCVLEIDYQFYNYYYFLLSLWYAFHLLYRICERRKHVILMMSNLSVSMPHLFVLFVTYLKKIV